MGHTPVVATLSNIHRVRYPMAMTPTHALLSLGLGAALCAGPVDDAPPEFGRVRWGRELEPALETSARSSKPVLLLFQEVPG